MPEHFHIILWPGPGTEKDTPDLSEILHDFKGQMGSLVIKRWRRLKAPVLRLLIDKRGRARFWQRGGGFDRNIRSDDELGREVTYIHNNPVKRGLVKSPTDWPWSSARWYAGLTDGPVKIDPVWWHNPRPPTVPQVVPLPTAQRPPDDGDPPRGG